MNVCQKEHQPLTTVIYAEDYDCPLCEALKQVAELKARLNFIQNSSGEMFVPRTKNNQNMGED